MDYIPKKKKITKKKNKVVKYKNLYPSEDVEKLYVGNFVLGTTNNLLQDTWNCCRSNINSLEDEDFLIVEFDGTNVVSINLLADAPLILCIIYTKVFTFKFSQDGEKVILHLYFTKLPIPNFNNKAANVVKKVFNVLYQISDDCIDFPVNSENKLIENIPELFKSVQRKQSSLEIVNYQVQSEHLAPTLRPYQEKSVSWMISQERKSLTYHHHHPAYCSIMLPTGIEIYYNKFIGNVELTQPLVSSLKTGGILADEMGLGKTVEILALILFHNSNNNNKQAEPMVFKKKRKIPPAVGTDEFVPSIPKKLNVPEGWTKKGKGQAYLLLSKWYNNTLVSVNDVQKKKKANYVQCVCGQHENHNRTVTCVDCERKQHEECMGFKLKFNEYRCPQCWNQQPRLKSRATLIVCPASLIDQWCKEICKHVKSGLSILHYEGSSICPVYPLELQDYDIVIMSYTVLQAELRQADFTEHKSLRAESKYANPGCVIILMEWHRLCFDEAQLVEGPTIAEMAQRLTAIHRWAITGTPISKGLSDLYVLIDFLQFEPYSELSTWENTLYEPYLRGDMEPVTDFLSKILWRTQKEDVLDQVNIPAQTTIEYYSDFTAIERYFYDKEHGLSCNDFLQKLKKLDMEKPLFSLNKLELKNIMAPLLSLRQACIHHNAVKGRYLVMKKPVNSMEELLDALIAKNINECEDYLRLIISSINGSAGVHLLLQNPVQAVVEYRKVLQLAAKFGEDKNNEIKLGVDKLQLIHTMHNLAEILPQCSSRDKTLRDDTLVKDCLDLENKFMERYINETTALVQTTAKVSNEIMALEVQLQLKRGQWFAAILEVIDEEELMMEFRSKLLVTLENNGYANNMLEITPKCLFYKLNSWDDQIVSLREEAIDDVNSLYDIIEDRVVISKVLVQAACNCHLRPIKKNKDKQKDCPLCKANTSLRAYELKLFSSTKRVNDVSNDGTWKPSVEEHTLKALNALGKFKRMDEVVIKDGDLSVALMELYKKEFKEVRKLWRYLDSQICASDEIVMCKIRMTLKNEQEEEEKNDKPNNLKNLSYELVNPYLNINHLREHELVYHLTHAQSEEIENTKNLEKCIGTHKYLQTLHVQQNSGQSPDPCPICKNQLDTKWNILKCGHCYCIECMQMLLGQTIGKQVACSICREKQSIDEINYIEISTAPKDPEGKKVKGNCSTKVENIVKLVMQLKEEKEDVKILIFSSWVAILKVLHNIFRVNNISSVVLIRSEHQNTLDVFKDPEKKTTVLLLPVIYGSRGLNLIEATHVIFVEPLLDPADELQAIGRVHRIGQTKPTVVHKFIMRDTIEESIFAATSSCNSDWDKNRVTLRQIKELFFKNAEADIPPEETVEVDDEMLVD